MTAALHRFALTALVVCLAAATAHAQLIGPTLAISGANCRFPDVAYGNVSRQYLVVWADYGGGSVRIWGALLRGDGTAVAAAFPISDAGFGGYFPAVAFNAASNEFLVTWDDGGDRGGVIFGQRVRGSDGALLGVNFPIGSVYGGIRSAVAWSPTSASYLVVFWGPGPGNTAAEIYGQRVNATGALLGGNYTISNDAVFSGYPAIAWASSGDQYLVSWDNFDGNILARRVNAATGALVGGNLTIATGGTNDRSCIAYDPTNPPTTRWLVQFNQQNAGFSYDQFGQFVNVDGTLAGGPLPLAHTAAFEGDTQFGGDVAFETASRRYLTSFGTDTGMGGQESLASGAPRGGQVVIGTGFYTSLSNAADTDTHRFLTAWEGLLAGSYTILGQLYGAAPDAVQNFTATNGDTQVQLAWQNPSDVHFTGTMIRMKTGSFPASATDGTLVVDKAGAPGASDGFTHTSLTNWTTYYYAAFAHDNGVNYSPAAQVLATPRPPAFTVSSSEFTSGTDGWTLDVWRAGTSSFGTVAWDGAAGNIMSAGSGATNSNDACTREGSIMTRLIPTTGRTSIQIEYDVMAALFAPPNGAPAGSCMVLEGSSEDKLVVYYSTSGTGGPWMVAQTLTEGVELPTGWTHKLINLAGVPGVGNNANFAVRFQWQFNSGNDSGRVDNVRVLSGAVTALIPAIGFTPGAFDRTLPAGTMTGDILRVNNTGDGTLNFTLTEDAPWLSVTPTSGTSNGPERTVAVAYNSAPVPVGDYSGVIQVSAAGAANTPQTIPATLRIVPAAQVWEPFAYYDGNLTTMGGANWSGAATSELTTETGALKIVGGTGTVMAQRSAASAGASGVIAAEIKIRGGSGTGDFFWSIFLDDASGNNLARWYGGSRHARGRVASTVTADMILTGDWDDLYVEIDTAANTSEFFFNGASFGPISHGATAGAAVAIVRIERNDRPTAGADIVRFDNLSLGPVETMLPRLNLTRNAAQAVLTWPAARHAAGLETTVSLTPANWSSVTGVPIANGSFQHTTPFSPSNRFFRLRR